MSEAEKPMEEMSFEQAMTALEAVVRQLESGQVDLERSIEIYERGAKLRKYCEEKLSTAEERIREITPDANGVAVGAEPAQIG